MLEANRKLVEQLDVKMKDFVSYQKMTYETGRDTQTLCRYFCSERRQHIYLSGGKSAQSAAQKESVEEVRKLLEEQERASGSTSGGDEQKYEEYFQKPER